MKAKQHDQGYEKARALEALAHLWLGNKVKARELSGAVLADFPENTLALAVHIRSTPQEVGLDEIVGTTEEHLRSDPDVAMALAEAAMIRNLTEEAETYAANAYKNAPGVAVTKEVLADVLVMRAHLEERFVLGRPATEDEIDWLDKANDSYTSAIAELSEKETSPRVIRLRLKRARVLAALGKVSEHEDDCRRAFESGPSDEEAVFIYATVKADHGELDEAIRLVESLVGKPVRPAVELMLAQLLSQRGNPGDKPRIRELLCSRVNDLARESPEFCTDYLSWPSDIEREISGAEAALALLDSVTKGCTYQESTLLLKAEVLRRDGNLEKAIETARELVPLVTESTHSDSIRRTATLLHALGLHRDALDLWKKIIAFDYVTTDTFRAIDCAQRCGDVQFILDLSSGLRANRIWNERLFELELTYRAQYNDAKTEIAILQEFLKQPLDSSYLPHARLRLSVAGIRMGKKELIETDARNLPRVTDVAPVIGQRVVEVLRRGPNPMLAAIYAYEMVRLHWDDPYAHSTMARVFFPDGPVPSIEEPTHVVPGATICYIEDDTKREHRHTIEDSPIGKPQSALNEYAPSEPISQAMLGKTVGEQFYLVKDRIQERTATVKEIVSKYKYRFNVSLKELSTRFSHMGFVREVVIAKEGDELDLSVLERLAKRRAESVNKMVDVYRDNFCPIYTMAVAANRSVIETVEFLIAGTDVKLRCCIGSDEEQEEAELSLNKARAIVLDTTALVTLLLTESFTALESLRTELVVTEGTLNDLRSAPCMHGDPQAQAGSFSTDGFTPTSPESILKARNAVQALVDFVEKRCHVEGGTVIASLETDLREQLLSGFGNAALESMLLASRSEGVLWTDDLATAAFAKGQFGCRRVWSQFLFDHFGQTGALSQDVSEDLAVKLFGMRYYYVRPSVPIILRAIKECDGDVDRPPLCQVLDWFSDKRAKQDGQFMMAAGTIKLLWQTSLSDGIAQRVTIRILERLALRPGGLDIVQGLLYNIDAIFGLDVVNAHRARQVIEAWLKGGGRRIILP